MTVGTRGTPDTAGASPLVEVRNLVKSFPIRAGVFRRQVGEIQAVAGVSFDIRPGETLGLVGESGSGKSTTGRTLLRLEEPTAGEVLFDGRALAGLDTAGLRELRREMQMIFQDPYASLNPRHTVGTLVREPLEIHRIGAPAERDRRVAELLDRVGLAPSQGDEAHWADPTHLRLGPNGAEGVAQGKLLQQGARGRPGPGGLQGRLT